MEDGMILMKKRELYRLVRKHSPYKLPKISETNFCEYKGTCWLNFYVRDKVCKVVYEQLSADEALMWIRLVDFFNNKTIYDVVIRPELNEIQ